jgi:UDP-N-acetylmuramoylalanine--D-glutamate ligase
MLELARTQRITVMGLGRFGGGAGVVRWLTAQGKKVLLTDLQSAAELREPLAQIADLPIELRLGRHDERDFTTADLVIANPAVPRPWENRYLRAASAAGVPITTEIRLLVERLHRQRVIGITGTAGKSTTAAMTHHILSRAGVQAHLGGNIGGSLLDSLDTIGRDDWIVLELSSYMLHWLGSGAGYPAAEGWSPGVAVLTNLEPNHLDWHGSFEHYEASKRNIFQFQRDGDSALTGEACDEPAHVPLLIPGGHNQRNARMAITAALCAVDLSLDDAATLLADFRGLPHRLELVAERDGMRFYNDSKSTTPQATALAVAAFDDSSRVHLIAGGYDKGLDLTPIAALAPQIAGLYTIGSTGDRLTRLASSRNATYCETLSNAIATAMKHMTPGDVLLLSPGCASWDQFTNYEQRGEAFKQCVLAHQSPATAIPGL